MVKWPTQFSTRHASTGVSCMAIGVEVKWKKKRWLSSAMIFGGLHLLSHQPLKGSWNSAAVSLFVSQTILDIREQVRLTFPCALGLGAYAINWCSSINKVLAYYQHIISKPRYWSCEIYHHGSEPSFTPWPCTTSAVRIIRHCAVTTPKTSESWKTKVSTPHTTTS